MMSQKPSTHGQYGGKATVKYLTLIYYISYPYTPLDKSSSCNVCMIPQVCTPTFGLKLNMSGAWGGLQLNANKEKEEIVTEMIRIP